MVAQLSHAITSQGCFAVIAAVILGQNQTALLAESFALKRRTVANASRSSAHPRRIRASFSGISSLRRYFSGTVHLIGSSYAHDATPQGVGLALGEFPMARRRKNDFEGLIGLGVIGFAIWLFVNNSAALGPVIVTIVTVAVVAFGALLILRFVREMWAGQRRNRVERSLRRKANSVTEQQLAALVRRRAQLVQSDAYGKPKMENWEKEIRGFISRHVQPSLTPDEQAALPEHTAALAMHIESIVQAAAKDQPFQTFADNMKPAEFETYCAGELRRAGWDARVTMQSRDQGVDVIAEKNRVRVVLQCKLYASPVGNKAVQEVAAGKAHEQAHYGIVVTNNRYTSGAEQLAATNGVLLLHYRDLQNLENILLGERNAATAPRGHFDRAKWNALLRDDPDIRMVADKFRQIGEKWVDEFAASYLATNDKNHLRSIISKVISDARKENEAGRPAP
jgi:restriction system protein